MADDLTDRLRIRAEDYPFAGEAADEIDRLRAQVAALQAEKDEAVAQVIDVEAALSIALGDQDAARAERDALIHDIEGYVQAASEQAADILRLEAERDALRAEVPPMRDALIAAHEFLMFAWREVAMNDYAEDKRSTCELAVFDAKLRAERICAAIDATRGEPAGVKDCLTAAGKPAEGNSAATQPAAAQSTFTGERSCCGTLLGSRHRLTCPKKGGPHA